MAKFSLVQLDVIKHTLTTLEQIPARAQHNNKHCWSIKKKSPFKLFLPRAKVVGNCKQRNTTMPKLR